MMLSRLSWLVFVLGLTLAAEASAVPVRWEFDGTVRVINGSSEFASDLAALGVAPGASVHGYFVFESTTPVFSTELDSTEVYLDPVSQAGFSVGSLVVSGGETGFDTVSVFHGDQPNVE